MRTDNWASLIAHLEVSTTDFHWKKRPVWQKTLMYADYEGQQYDTCSAVFKTNASKMTNTFTHHLYWYPNGGAGEHCAYHCLMKVKLTCATLMPVQKLMFPRGCTAWSLDSILPVSGVSVVSTSQLLHREKTLLPLYWHILNVSTVIPSHCLLLCHGDEAHIVFRVAASLGVTNNINCILLSLQPGGQKVSIAHVLTVVHTKEKQKYCQVFTMWYYGRPIYLFQFCMQWICDEHTI